MSREINQTPLSSLERLGRRTQLIVRYLWQELRWGYNEKTLEEQLAAAQGTISLSARKAYIESQAWEKHISESLKASGLPCPETIALRFPYSESAQSERNRLRSLPADELNAEITVAAKNWLNEHTLFVPKITIHSD